MGRTLFAEALGLGHVQNGLHALRDAFRRLVLLDPDRQKDLKHFRLVDF